MWRLLLQLRERQPWLWPTEWRELCWASLGERVCDLDPAEHTYQHKSRDGFRWAA